MDISNSAGLRMLELILIAFLSGDDKTCALQLAEQLRSFDGNKLRSVQAFTQLG
jgi:hypothetical protein